MKALPLFYYPTTIAWLDDDNLFLTSAQKCFGENQQVKPFAHPNDCLQFFKHYQSLLSNLNFMRAGVEYENYDAPEHLPIDLNIEAFAQLREHPARYQEISVMIVDYHMPDMNGIELCRQLHYQPMKKILLTGEADQHQAVAAFNEGTIDCFLRKDSPTLVVDIQKHLQALKQQYFYSYANPLLLHLETEHQLALSDQAFIKFFKAWCEMHHIQEYYPMDKYGNLLVVDQHGKTSHFIIHTDYTLNAFTELNGDEEEGAILIQAVASRKKVPFFGIGKASWQCAVTDWDKYFYVPQVFEGRERYYWVVV